MHAKKTKNQINKEKKRKKKKAKQEKALEDAKFLDERIPAT